MRLRVVMSLIIAIMLVGPGMVTQTQAKSGKAAAKAAKSKAKAQAKAKAKTKTKAIAKDLAQDRVAADAAREELKKESEKAAYNQARITVILWHAGVNNDAALKEMGQRLKTKEGDRHKAVTDHYEAIVAKTPGAAAQPEEEKAE